MRALICLLMLGCGGAAVQSQPATPSAHGAWSAGDKASLASLRLDHTVPPDPTNAVADDPRAVRLGRALFYDTGLTPDSRFSCATCHKPDAWFTDLLPLGIAAGTTARHTPTVLGAAVGPWFFWDGRADSLWAQAMGPLENADEMGSDRLFVAHEVLSRYRSDYEPLFGAVPDLSDATRFPARGMPGDVSDPLGEAWHSMREEDRSTVNRVFVNAVKAIAAFERTVMPTEAPFDRYVDAVVAGDDTGGSHLDASAVRGLEFFLHGGNCISCHNGPMLTDRAFHSLGLPEPRGYDPGRTGGAVKVASSEFNCEGEWSDADDCAELRFLNPAFEDFRAAFKTPSLRNVAETAPYTHTGGFASLEAVLDFYSELPGDPVLGHRELTLQPLRLDAQTRSDLIAFLRSLTGPVPESLLPPG